MFRSLETYFELIRKMGGREPRIVPGAGKLIEGTFPIFCTIPDNAVTEQDLTAQAALVSTMLLQYFGDQADSPFVLWGERMAVTIQEGTETPVILHELAKTLYMRHNPARGNGANRYIDLGKYVRSLFSSVSRATTDGLAVTMSLPHPDSFCEIDGGPLFVDNARDVFVVATETAVNGAAAVPCTIWVDGWAFPRFDDAGAVLMDGCGSPENVDAFIRQDYLQRIKARLLKRGQGDLNQIAGLK